MNFSELDWSQLASNWGSTVLFCLGIYIVTLLLRNAVEWKWPKKTGKDSFWEDVLLPAMPAVFGIAFTGCVSSYPYPAMVKTFAARVFFGCVCGFFSAWIYKVLKGLAKMVLGKYGVSVPDPVEATVDEAQHAAPEEAASEQPPEEKRLA